jgi:hypothetical protein
MPAVRLLVATKGQAPNTIYLGDDGETLVAKGAADKQLAFSSDYSGFTTDASVSDASRSIHTTAETGWVVVPADRLREVRFTSANAITVRVPSQLQVDLPIGVIGTYRQDGAGAITFVGDSGVTVANAPGASVAKTGGAGSVAILEKVGAQQVRLTGFGLAAA